MHSGDLAFLNEWLLVDVADVSSRPTARPRSRRACVWDGERLFQAGRFTTEMEYQHLVFEEFGRKMQPDIDAFVFEPSVDINPNIAAEFAHVVYRFGHSMLREDIARHRHGCRRQAGPGRHRPVRGLPEPGRIRQSLGDAEAAAGAIIRGMSRQVGNEIDEFVTDVLRNSCSASRSISPRSTSPAAATSACRRSTRPARSSSTRRGDTQLKPYDELGRLRAEPEEPGLDHQLHRGLWHP